MLVWLREFSHCMSTFRFPKIWHRENVTAILKSNKPADDAKNYLPISFLCMPLESPWAPSLLSTRARDWLTTPTAPSWLPPWSFHYWPIHFTDWHIEAGFEVQQKVDVVLVDLAAVDDTTWLLSLHSSSCKWSQTVVWSHSSWSSSPTAASNWEPAMGKWTTSDNFAMICRRARPSCLHFSTSTSAASRRQYEAVWLYQWSGPARCGWNLW